jgi:MFS family permease
MTVPQPQSTPSATAWAALRYPQFRWFFLAQMISIAGSSMQLAAVNWHVWNLTRSELALGVVGLVRIVPIIVLSLLGGVVADAVDRRKLQIYTQSAMLVFAGILGISTLTGSDSLLLIYLMTAGIAGMIAFDQPARNALLPNLIPNHELPNAVRLNVLMFQITAMVGPVLAGLLLGALGPGLAYTLNALSFLPVIVVLFMLRVGPIQQAAGSKREISLRAMMEGLRFVRGERLLWSSMLLDFIATFLASAIVLLPVYSTEILKVDATGYGILSAAPAIGSTLGALLMAQYAIRVRRQGLTMVVSVAVFGAATIIFGLSSVFVVSLLALALTGFADAISTAIRGPLRQMLTPDHLRGRMLSVNMIFFMGGPQLGEFEAGVVAHLAGPVFSVVSGGILTVAAAAAIAYAFPDLRAYREQDVIERQRILAAQGHTL